MGLRGMGSLHILRALSPGSASPKRLISSEIGRGWASLRSSKPKTTRASRRTVRAAASLQCSLVRPSYSARHQSKCARTRTEREDSHERCSYRPQGRHDSHLHGCGRDGSGNRHRSAAEPHHSGEVRRQGRLSRHSGVLRQEASAAAVEGRRGSLREGECRAGQVAGRIPPHGKRRHRPRRRQRDQGRHCSKWARSSTSRAPRSARASPAR